MSAFCRVVVRGLGRGAVKPGWKAFQRSRAACWIEIKGVIVNLFVIFLDYAPRPRIQLNGVPLHIVQRGHNREACFFGEEDYTSYLHWLGETG